MSEPEIDVVVVGAGIAGVTAARDLSREGYSVVLLEARDRVGGRLYSTAGPNGVLELGGGYVHWTQPHIWRELQRHELDHLTPPLESEEMYWFAQGKVHNGSFQDWMASAGPYIQQFFADARTHFPQPYDNDVVQAATEIDKQSISDRIAALGQTDYGRDCVEGALGGLICSAEKHGVAQLLMGSAITFGEYGFYLETAGQWFLASGTKALINAIQAESSAQLELNAPVKSITESGANVTVKTQTGKVVTGKIVLVTVPLNTIGNIAIEPPLLPSVSRMIELKNPTLSAKVWARVKGHIKPFSALAPPGSIALNAVRVEKRCGSDTYVLCMCAQASMIPSDAEERRNVVEKGLRVFVPDIEVVDTATHDWVGDEFSQGAWMIHRPGQMTGAAHEIRKPHGRIFFAGGDIAAVNPGSIEGAMDSAASAARSIAKVLRSAKQCA